MKGKLSELYPHRPLPRGQSQSRRAASAQAVDPDLTGLAEKQFAPGIFSQAPSRTPGET
jgi:hypothetical protein